MFVVLHVFGIWNKQKPGRLHNNIDHTYSIIDSCPRSPIKTVHFHICSTYVPCYLCVCGCTQICYCFSKGKIRNPIHVVLPHCCETHPAETNLCYTGNILSNWKYEFTSPPQAPYMALKLQGISSKIKLN